MRTYRLLVASLAVLSTMACSAAANTDDSSSRETARTDSRETARTDNASSPVLDVRIRVSNTCAIEVDPPSYSVPQGGTFTVNWINLASSDYSVDIDKIDRFNRVPIVIGLEPGQNVHDTVREWCGQYTGTFSFHIQTACDDFYMPIDCNQ